MPFLVGRVPLLKSTSEQMVPVFYPLLVEDLMFERESIPLPERRLKQNMFVRRSFVVGREVSVSMIC